MKVKTITFILLAVSLTLFAVPVYAQGDIPPLPHAFYGEVEVNGDLAPAGTEVEARGEGVQTDVGNNPVIVAVDGSYGSSNPLEPKLVAQGNIADGTILTFYVNGVSTERTAEWHSGGVTELDLTVTIEGPPPGTTNVSGTISNTGVFTDVVEARSSDDLCRLTINGNTVGLTMNGEPLSEIKITRMGVPPAPPAGAHVAGRVYDLKPDGATFSPAITLKYTYDPAQIPEGVAENELVLTWWDAGASNWVEMDAAVDPEANTITALVSHFTAFAALAYEPPEPATESVLEPTPETAAFSLSSLNISPEEVAPGESVTISIEIANTGEEAGNYEAVLKINGVVEASKGVSINAGISQRVTFTTSKDEAKTYSVDVNGLSGTFVVNEETISAPPAPPIPPAPPATTLLGESVNWPVLWGAICGVIMAGLIILLLARRKRHPRYSDELGAWYK